MERFKINYSYDEKSKMFIGACPELFGFLLHCETLKDLKKCTVKVLRVYMHDNTISAKNIEFTDLDLQKEKELSL